MNKAGANICQAYAAIPLPGEATGWPARTPALLRRGACPSIPPGSVRASRPAPSEHPARLCGRARLCDVMSKTISVGFMRLASPHGGAAALPEPRGGFPGLAEAERGLRHRLLLCCS